MARKISRCLTGKEYEEKKRSPTPLMWIKACRHNDQEPESRNKNRKKNQQNFDKSIKMTLKHCHFSFQPTSQQFQTSLRFRSSLGASEGDYCRFLLLFFSWHCLRCRRRMRPISRPGYELLLFTMGHTHLRYRHFGQNPLDLLFDDAFGTRRDGFPFWRPPGPNGQPTTSSIYCYYYVWCLSCLCLEKNRRHKWFC